MGAVYQMDDTTSAIYGTPGYQAPEIGDSGPEHPFRPLHRRSHARGLVHRFARLPDHVRQVAPRRRRGAPVRGVRLALPLPRAGHRGGPRRPLPVGRRDGGAARGCPTGDRGSGIRHSVAEPSATFTSELRSGSEDPDDWRALPAPLIAADDPAAAFLASLAVAVTEPDEILELLALAPERTVEVRTARSAHAHRGRPARRRRHVARPRSRVANPWEWRVAWSTGCNALAQADADRARAEFRGVYASLPGELAPKLAMALRRRERRRPGARRALVRHRRPHRSGVHDRRLRAGPLSHRSSATSPARSRRTNGSRRPRARTSTRRSRKVDTMLDAEGRALTVDDVVAAGASVARLPLPKEQQARLTASVLERRPRAGRGRDARGQRRRRRASGRFSGTR